jgi:RNA polymerase primary sigma factor
MDMPNEHDESDRYAVTESTLHTYLREIAQIPLLSPEDEVALAARARTGDQKALDQLIVSNLRYVVTVARKYVGYGLPLTDLINEGNIGLIQAAKRFDPGRGVKFITYAAWWIRKAIGHALAEQAGATSLPVKQLGTLLKIAKAHRRYVQRTGEEPSSAELAEELGLLPEQVEDLLRVYRHYISLDVPIGSDEEVSILDLMQATSFPPVEKMLIKATLTREVEELLGQLPPREQHILRLRFGFDNEPKTLEEIGQMLGLTRERVRQIEKQAKEHLRVKAKMKALEDYLN